MAGISGLPCLAKLMSLRQGDLDFFESRARHERIPDATLLKIDQAYRGEELDVRLNILEIPAQHSGERRYGFELNRRNGCQDLEPGSGSDSGQRVPVRERNHLDAGAHANPTLQRLGPAKCDLALGFDHQSCRL